MDEELFEYLYVTGQVDELFGLKEDNEEELDEEEEQSYRGR